MSSFGSHLWFGIEHSTRYYLKHWILGPMLLINITSSGHSQLNMWQLSRTAFLCICTGGVCIHFYHWIHIVVLSIISSFCHWWPLRHQIQGLLQTLAHTTTMFLLNSMDMFSLCGAIKNQVSRAWGFDLRVCDIVSHYFLKIRRVELVIALKHSTFPHDGFHRSSINFHFD